MQSVKSKTTLTQKFKRKIMSKKMTEYIADFNYFDKALIALIALSGIASAIFALVFYFDNRNDKETVRANKK